MAYQEELKAKKRDEFKHIAVFPCKLKILPQFIFNTRDPIVVGVIVEAGVVKEGTPICVPDKEFLEIGRVTSIEINHKQMDKATKGQEVCIKIEPTGESPKMLGRHFEETDLLVSKVRTYRKIHSVAHIREMGFRRMISFPLVVSSFYEYCTYLCVCYVIHCIL